MYVGNAVINPALTRQLTVYRVDGYSTFLPGNQTLTVPDDIVIAPGSSQAGLASSPNRTAGPWAYQTLFGDFDARVRIDLREANDGAIVSPIASGVKYGAITVAATVSGAPDWIEMATRVSSAGRQVLLTHSSSNGTTSSQGPITVAHNRTDLRIIRNGQIFRGLYREADDNVPLASEDGWQFYNSFNKGTSPMPPDVLVGPMLRSSGTDFANMKVRVRSWQVDAKKVHP